eukprot:Blabericola_migrator_1__10019@NODE_554_length_7641_cov_83_757592_g417_i0_p3_GENE_NODE_554_length_7641_cov_83_757592_g417_i0NODE_554_length_7641_cov_83_757592_g417_i0_p3_ORF_typecomplete_len422_score76_52Nup160/PF11715_8/0_023DUF2789/PF10982_8/84DUF2789/PF10982_8/13_NODE_554_length_7641_cov_83_757592_g417_i063517616
MATVNNVPSSREETLLQKPLIGNDSMLPSQDSTAGLHPPTANKENIVSRNGAVSTAATHKEVTPLESSHSSLVAIPIQLGLPSSSSAVSTIINLPISDPVSAMHIGRHGLTFGTYLGKVVSIHFESPLDEYHQYSVASSSVSSSLKAHLCLYAAFNEDAIRMVYSTADRVYAVVGNAYCIDWPKRSSITGVKEDATRFDRRISPSVKYVLPNGQRCLIASLGVTVVFDCVSQVQLLCPLRLPDIDVIPLDFCEDMMLAFIHNEDDPVPVIKVLKLPTSTDEPKWGVAVESILHQELPGVTGIAKARFWSADRFTFIANGRHIYVYEVPTARELTHWTSGKYDICGLATLSDDCIVTISEDSTLAVWSLEANGSIYTTSLKPCRFSLGVPFHVSTYNNLVFFSADEEIGCVTVPLKLTPPPP